MGAALFELENILRKNNQYTSKEANILMQCKSKAMRDFIIAASITAPLGFLATPRGMRRIRRLSIATGVGALCGEWCLDRSLDSSVADILSIEGSRMQKELANIIVQKHPSDHWAMQLIKKHFYLEKVFDDTSGDQPILRWRYKTFFVDQNVQRTSDEISDSERSNSSEADWKDTDEPKQASMTVQRYPAIDPTSDPFDSIFGDSLGNEEIHHAGISSAHKKKHQHGHKRHRRRNRMRQREAPVGLQLAQY